MRDGIGGAVFVNNVILFLEMATWKWPHDFVSGIGMGPPTQHTRSVARTSSSESVGITACRHRPSSPPCRCNFSPWPYDETWGDALREATPGVTELVLDDYLRKEELDREYKEANGISDDY